TAMPLYADQLPNITPITPEAALERALPSLGISRADLDVRPSRWETAMTLPGTEKLLSDPLALPSSVRDISGAVESARTSSELIHLAGALLSIQTDPVALPSWEAQASPKVEGVPLPIVQDVARLSAAIESVRLQFMRSVDSLYPDERQSAQRAMQAAVLRSL